MPSTRNPVARVAGAVLLVLALPSSALALTAPAAEPILTASAGTAKHYAVSFSASPYGAELDFQRSSHGSTQAHSLSNDGQAGVSYTAATDLSSATIVTKWGSHGKVSLTFKATGRARNLLPKGCTGKAALSRTGFLTGTLKAKMDKRFFKTFSRKRLSATLSEPGKFFCGPGAGGFGGPGLTSLGVRAKSGGLDLSFVRFGRGALTESASVVTSSGPGDWLLRHTITATAPHASLSVAADSSSARAKGEGPFLAGTLRFKVLVGSHPPNSAAGTVSGSFVAKFDSIGAKRVKRGAAATLSQP
jgi:hypothetical protein